MNTFNDFAEGLLKILAVFRLGQLKRRLEVTKIILQDMFACMYIYMLCRSVRHICSFVHCICKNVLSKCHFCWAMHHQHVAFYNCFKVHINGLSRIGRWKKKMDSYCHVYCRGRLKIYFDAVIHDLTHELCMMDCDVKFNHNNLLFVNSLFHTCPARWNNYVSSK